MRNTRTCCGRRITSADGSARSACILHAADAQRSVPGQARERRSTFDRGNAAHACELTVHDLIRFSVSTFSGGIASTFSGGAQQERAKNTMHRLDLFLCQKPYGGAQRFDLLWRGDRHYKMVCVYGMLFFLSWPQNVIWSFKDCGDEHVHILYHEPHCHSFISSKQITA